MNTTHLIIVVPCYNEESVLPETIRQLSGVLNRMLENGKISIGKILFVDDGSKDKTWEIITEAGKTNGLVAGLIGALLARGHASGLAATLGVWTHALAGIRLSRDFPMRGNDPHDIADALPRALAPAGEPNKGDPCPSF